MPKVITDYDMFVRDVMECAGLIPSDFTCRMTQRHGIRYCARKSDGTMLEWTEEEVQIFARIMQNGYMAWRFYRIKDDVGARDAARGAVVESLADILLKRAVH